LVRKGREYQISGEFCILRTDIIVAEIASSGVGFRAEDDATSFNEMLNQYTVLQQQIMIESMEMQKPKHSGTLSRAEARCNQ